MTSIKRRGFSLIESLITMLLVGSLFVMVAGLLNDSYKAIRHEREQSQRGESVRSALTRVSCELREATLIYALDGPTGLSFAKETEDRRLKINYQLQETELLRVVYDLGAGTSATYVAAHHVAGFRCQNPPGDPTFNNLQVSLTFADQDRAVRVVTSEVCPMALLVRPTP